MDDALKVTLVYKWTGPSHGFSGDISVDLLSFAWLKEGLLRSVVRGPWYLTWNPVIHGCLHSSVSALCTSA